MNKKVVAMVLVGGRGSRLENITKHTAKPAVSFGGKYRLIDFVLSNLSNSKIDTVGLITQYEPHDLMKYIGHGATWDLDVNDGGVSFLTPYTSLNGDLWQQGTAHAIKQHFYFIDQYNPEHVIILSGDHIYKMDYQKMIDSHIDTRADISIGTFTVKNNPSRYGILEVAHPNTVIGFEEKPNTPKSQIASMGVYVFKREVLRALLNTEKKGMFDFGKDIIPLALEHNLNIKTHQFDGYFKDVGTVKSLYNANMDLLVNPQYLKLHEYKDWPIYTKSSNLPPHHLTETSHVTSSMISDGSLINGVVSNSIIGSGCLIDIEAKISNSIIFNDVKINSNCIINNAIVLDGTVVPERVVLDFEEVTVIDNEYLWKLGEINE